MPLHPLIVHFPIALLVFGAVIEIVNVFFKKETLNKFGTLLITFGVISGIFALLSGEGAEEFAFQNWGRGFHDQVELHAFFANISIILFGILAIVKIMFKYSLLSWNGSQINKGLISIVIVFLSISGIVSLAITGDLGGKIVYENDNIIIDNTSK
ncbi:DUF2231 domain-containing protein [Viridibacillus sp. NPDC093762]|uniref:DUF2231 domain-containing protein n=1 Tax=Viridibacillus sp. NPDC093762 TaxID=3390720 RepID=UPI003D015AF7